MSELAIRESNLPDVLVDPTGGRLVAWAAAAHAANQLAVALCRTAFAPQHFQGNPGDTTAAILAGDELGLSPLAAMRSIYVVHGTPALYARTMVALVQSRGHEVWTEKSGEGEVVVCGKRRGSDRVERSSWTIARAQRAGYTGNKKYASNPQEMLYAKAASEICRKIAADVLLGVPAAVEDLELEDTEPAPPRKVQRRKSEVAEAPAPEPEPDPDPEPDAAETITAAQQRKLHASLNECGLADRDDALAWIGGVIGHDLDTTKALTKDEASKVIDRLERTIQADAEPEPDPES